MDERIRVVYPVTDLARDGAQRQLFELVKGLDKDYFDPVVLALQGGGPLEGDLEKIPGVRLIKLERSGKLSFLRFIKVFQSVKKINPHVIQPFLTPATFWGILAAIVYRVPVKIVTERCGPGRTGLPLKYRAYLKMEDLLSRFADQIVANSEAGREFLLQRGVAPERLNVIYNGLNFDRLVPDVEKVAQLRQDMGLPPEGKVVGILARLAQQKRHDNFLEAAAIISEVVPDTRFAIVGDGELRGSLEEQTRQLRLEDKVTFFGEQRDVGTYVSSFDIAVSASETEGCSNSLLEAMALGKPVVATDVGGNKEVIDDGDSGLLVAPDNPQALAEGILKMLQTPGLITRMGEKARLTIIDRFSLEKMVHQYESLWKDILVPKLKKRVVHQFGE